MTKPPISIHYAAEFLYHTSNEAGDIRNILEGKVGRKADTNGSKDADEDNHDSRRSCDCAICVRIHLLPPILLLQHKVYLFSRSSLINLTSDIVNPMPTLTGKMASMNPIANKLVSAAP